MERALELEKLIPLLIPILIIQLGLQIYALVDLYRRPDVRGGILLWAIIILLGEIIGPVVYFIVARREE
jgi:hypothetical protein